MLAKASNRFEKSKLSRQLIVKGSSKLGNVGFVSRSRALVQKSLVHMHKHWDNVKSRRKRELVEETLELMNNGKGPYKSHKPSCPKVEVVAPHFKYHLGYEWDGDAVAAAKRHQIFNSDMIAALRSRGYTVAGNTILEYLDTTVNYAHELARSLQMVKIVTRSDASASSGQRADAQASPLSCISLQQAY
uniref:Uncharacterized protein n=1 Tax=Timema bartmani TaxID=61472 RepID=A0A7R9I3F7_9NEOP|nr:unnamed protein product [Timema bartmani]